MGANALASRLTRALGLPLAGVDAPDPDSPHAVILFPFGLDPKRAFSIRITPRWHNVEAILTPGIFAGTLVNEMVKRLSANTAFLEALQRTSQRHGWSLEVDVEQADTDAGRPSSIMIRAVSPRSTMTPNVESDVMLEAGELVLSAALAIMPVEEIETAQVDEGAIGLPEGALVRVVVNKYERSPVNRAIAILAHGARCAVCGFDFERTYGVLGRGFIHIHHRVPVSRIGSDYVIDPVKDLVPVCPNCHVMLHVQDPPIEPEELARIIRVSDVAPGGS